MGLGNFLNQHSYLGVFSIIYTIDEWSTWRVGHQTVPNPNKPRITFVTIEFEFEFKGKYKEIVAEG